MKVRFAALTYRTKLTVAIMLTSAIVVALTCLAFLVHEMTTLRRSIGEQQLALAQFTAHNATASVVFYDQAAATENLSNFRFTPQVRHAAIFATGMTEPLASYHRQGFGTNALEKPSRAAKAQSLTPDLHFGDEDLQVTVPILVDQELLGHLELDVSLDIVRQRMLTYIGIGSLVFVLVLGIAFAIARLLSFLVSRPVERLSAAMVQVKETRDYSRHVAKSNHDEFGRLIDSFNAMLDEIARRDTRTEQLVEQLKAARDEAEAASVAKSQFLANMSHELRTPLNAVIGYTEIIEEDMEEAGLTQTSDDLRRIKTSAHHLLSLINEVLDLSKIEAGRMEIDIHAFALAPLIDDALATLAPMIRQRGNAISVDIEEHLELTSDSTKLKQILINLLSNANKFTEGGKIFLTAASGQDHGREYVALTVADTGIGMSRQQIDGLFRPFSQADPSITRKFGGTGLGLTITQRFVKMLGGELNVASRPGTGSAFTIHIPCRLDTGDAGRGSLAKAQSHLRNAAGPAQAQPLVLVIDDEADARDLLERWLPRLGYDVVTAASGNEGLVAARHLRPAAVLVDCDMPNMDGRGFIQRLREDEKLRALPAILCGRGADPCGIDPVVEADMVLAKPIDRSALGAALAVATNQPTGHLLLIDDDEAFRSRLAGDLRDAGYTVTDTGDGEHALSLLHASPIDAVITDLLMPDMSGQALIGRICSDAELAKVCRIVFSAKELDPKEQAALAEKVSAIIAKGPYGNRRLFEVLRRTLTSAATSAIQSHERSA